MKKRIFALILSALMVFFCAVICIDADNDALEGFEDIKRGSWYEENVRFVCERGIMTGMSKTEFAPLDNMTRAQFVTILYRISRSEETGLGAELKFSDTNPSAWYANAVGWGVKEGLVGGYSDNTFKPNANISRQEIAKLVCVFFEKTGVNTDLCVPMTDSFADKSTFPEWSRDYIEQLRTYGIIAGDSSGRFNPKANASRAEVATIFRRYIEGFDDEMYYAVDAYLSRRLCEKHDAVDLSIGKSEIFNRDDFGELLLSELGLHRNTYRIIFDEGYLYDMVSNFGSIDLGSGGEFSFTFRIYNTDTHKLTDYETVKFYLNKTVESYSDISEETVGVTGAHDCMEEKPLLTFSKNIKKNHTIENGAIVLTFDDSVTVDGITEKILEPLGMTFGIYKIKYSGLDETAIQTRFNALKNGEGFTTDTVGIKAYTEMLGMAYEAGEIKYPLYIKKVTDSSFEEKLPVEGTRFNIDGDASKESTVTDFVKAVFAEYGSAELVSSPSVVVKAYGLLSEGESRAVPVTVRVTSAHGYKVERRYLIGVGKEYIGKPDGNAAFKLVDDGKIVSAIMISRYVTRKELVTYSELREKIYEKTGYFIDLVTDLHGDVTENRILLGQTDFNNPSALGEATSYDYVLTLDGKAMTALGRTSGANIQAAEALAESLVTDGDTVYVPQSVIGIHDRELPVTVHAFDELCISFWGDCFYADPNGDQEAIYQSIKDYGADEVYIEIRNPYDGAEVERTRAIIERLYSDGMTTRLYCNNITGDAEYIFGDDMWQNKEYYRPLVKHIVDTFGDLEGITTWGLYDEPASNEDMKYCNDIIELFEEYDTAHRRVYVNLGPLFPDYTSYNYIGHDAYDRTEEYIPELMYYTFDKYVFGALGNPNTDSYLSSDFFKGLTYEEIHAKIDAMSEEDRNSAWIESSHEYGNLEVNRNYAVDNSVDNGVTIGASRIGGNDRTEKCDTLMKWQVNLVLAYNSRYLEHFPFYYVHDWCLLGPSGAKTWRYEMSKQYDEYVREISAQIIDKRLDCVFYLENTEGGYEELVTPYYGYHGLGAIDGNDALLSFFSDGTVIITDKRVEKDYGLTHDLVIEGFEKFTEWYNTASHSWEDISTCEAVSGNTLTLSLAAQYLFR